MRNFLHVFMDGNLTGDPEVKKLKNGANVSKFSIAVNHGDNRENSENNDVSFVDIEAWDKVGENCAEYLKKGRKVTIIGSMKQDRWKSADGTVRQKFKVIASHVRFDSFPAKQEAAERQAA